MVRFAVSHLVVVFLCVVVVVRCTVLRRSAGDNDHEHPAETKETLDNLIATLVGSYDNKPALDARESTRNDHGKMATFVSILHVPISVPALAAGGADRGDSRQVYMEFNVSNDRTTVATFGVIMNYRLNDSKIVSDDYDIISKSDSSSTTSSTSASSSSSPQAQWGRWAREDVSKFLTLEAESLQRADCSMDWSSSTSDSSVFAGCLGYDQPCPLSVMHGLQTYKRVHMSLTADSLTIKSEMRLGEGSPWMQHYEITTTKRSGGGNALL